MRSRVSRAAGWRCESNRFKVDAGMKFVSIVTVGQHLSNVLQRHRIRQINQCSKIGVGLSPGSAQTLSAASNPAPWSTK